MPNWADIVPAVFSATVAVTAAVPIWAEIVPGVFSATVAVAAAVSSRLRYLQVCFLQQ